jgi:hypothetical protein
MALLLKESRAVRELAEVFYDFLPGSGSAAWKGRVSFKSVAEKVGVGDFWQPGSNLPMLTALLERPDGPQQRDRSSISRVTCPVAGS